MKTFSHVMVQIIISLLYFISMVSVQVHIHVFISFSQIINSIIKLLKSPGKKDTRKNKSCMTVGNNAPGSRLLLQDKSCVMRKQDFCLWENKVADQLCHEKTRLRAAS